jgi:hypothetical protein
VNYVDGGTEAFVEKLLDAGVEVEVFVQEGWEVVLIIVFVLSSS